MLSPGCPRRAKVCGSHAMNLGQMTDRHIPCFCRPSRRESHQRLKSSSHVSCLSACRPAHLAAICTELTSLAALPYQADLPLYDSATFPASHRRPSQPNGSFATQREQPQHQLRSHWTRSKELFYNCSRFAFDYHLDRPSHNLRTIYPG